MENIEDSNVMEDTGFENMKYSDAMRELEEIIRKMEGDSCDIDSLYEYTTRAMKLLKFCKTKLFSTNKEIEECLEQLRAITE